MIQHLNIALVCIAFAGSKFYHHSPKDNVTCNKTVSFTEVNAIIEKRCISCNSSKATAEVYTAAPNGVVYNTTQDIVKMKEKRKQ